MIISFILQYYKLVQRFIGIIPPEEKEGYKICPITVEYRVNWKDFTAILPKKGEVNITMQGADRSQWVSLPQMRLDELLSREGEKDNYYVLLIEYERKNRVFGNGWKFQLDFFPVDGQPRGFLLKK